MSSAIWKCTFRAQIVPQIPRKLLGFNWATCGRSAGCQRCNCLSINDNQTYRLPPSGCKLDDSFDSTCEPQKQLQTAVATPLLLSSVSSSVSWCHSRRINKYYECTVRKSRVEWNSLSQHIVCSLCNVTYKKVGFIYFNLCYGTQSEQVKGSMNFVQCMQYVNGKPHKCLSLLA